MGPETKDGETVRPPEQSPGPSQVAQEERSKSPAKERYPIAQTIPVATPQEDNDEERVTQGMEQIAALQYKASYYDVLQKENATLRGRMDELSSQLERVSEKKPIEESPAAQNAILMKLMSDQMKTFQEAMHQQMQAMQQQLLQNPARTASPTPQKTQTVLSPSEKVIPGVQMGTSLFQAPQESSKVSLEKPTEILTKPSMQVTQTSPLTFSETQVPRVQIPPLNQMPKYDGSEKGLAATSWLIDLEQMRPLYNLQDVQLVALARCSLTGKARSWTETQPFNQTWDQFKKAFCREWGERNQEKLFVEMLNHIQGESSVGEYATDMCRFFMQLEVSAEKQREYFVKNLRPGIKESTFSRNPVTLADAVEVAREAENMYYTVSGKRDEPGTEVKEIKRKVEMLALQKANTSNPSPQSSPFSAGRPPRCPKCLQEGHAIPRFCTNEPKVPFLSCCNYWGRHRPGSLCEGQPIPPMPNNATKRNNVREQPNAHMMEETSLSYSDSEGQNVSETGHEVFAGEPSSDSASGETDYISSDESRSDTEDEDMFAGKRAREETGPPRATSGRAPPSKTQKKDATQTTHRKNSPKVVKNPLSEEQKQKIREKKAKNREILSEQNQGIARAILKDCSQVISAHHHLKHFRTDLHRYLDKLLFHPAHERKARTPARAPSGHVAAGDVVDAPGHRATSSFSHKEIYIKDSVPSHPFVQDEDEETEPLSTRVSRHVENPESNLTVYCGLQNAFRKKYPIRTEVMAEIEHCGEVRIGLDSGATFSGINARQVEQAGLSKKVRPTRMTYRTSSGEIRPAEGKVVVKLRIGSLIIKAPMAVMPRECSYNVLLANDVMGPLDVDICRSQDAVLFHFQGREFAIPLLMKHAEQKEGVPESYFVTTVNDYPAPWLDAVPSFGLAKSKNL